jgi:trk system potassium uptake protein TrkA
MRVILLGGGETVEAIYFLARLFVRRGYDVTIVDPSPAEAQTLSRRVKATVLVGDGSDPVVLEEAGARQADLVLSLTPQDPDNLVACQVAQKLFGVPRTLALVNDPENEEVFSSTKVIGSLIEGRTVFDEITHLFPADEGRRYVTEVVLDGDDPVIGQTLADLELPPESLVVAIIRDGDVVVPGGEDRLRVADRLIVIALPEYQERLLLALAGQEA